MSEVTNSPEQSLLPEQQMLMESQARFAEVSSQLAESIPELAARPEILTAGKELIDEFGIKPSLFEDEGRSVVFAGIASRWADAKMLDASDGSPEKALVADAATFTADTIALLAYEHSDRVEAAKQILADESDTAHTKKVYERYTDPKLTDAVKQSIADGLLDDVKQKLQVTKDNEDPYDVRVLSMADEDLLHGLDAPRPDYDNLPYNDPDLLAAEQLKQDVRDWKEGLVERADNMMDELGWEGTVPPAWVTTVDGKRTICISTALAEKILDPSVAANTDWYTEKDLQADFAFLAHEYTHTQGKLNVDGNHSFGMNLEEIRAEHFSGDKHGYQDIKSFFKDYRILTGHDISAEMDEYAKGGSMTEIFGSIANRVGLSNMVGVLLAAPSAYIHDQTNNFFKEAHQYIGGFDGVQKALYDAEIDKGNGEAISKRLDKSAEHLLKLASDNEHFLEFFLSYNKGKGLNFVTDILAERVQELSDKQPVAV